MTDRDMRWITAAWIVLVVAALALMLAAGCASGGKQAGVVPISVEAPDTATADNGSAASTGWFSVQSTGGSIGLAVVSFAFLGFMAWALTKLYDRFVCRYPQACEHKEK